MYWHGRMYEDAASVRDRDGAEARGFYGIGSQRGRVARGIGERLNRPEDHPPRLQAVHVDVNTVVEEGVVRRLSVLCDRDY